MRCKGTHFFKKKTPGQRFFAENYYFCRIKHKRESMDNLSFDIRLIFAILNSKVSAQLLRRFAGNFKQYGVDITPEQWTVLHCLWAQDGQTQQELCNKTLRDKPSMTRLIDTMEKANLVVRIQDTVDRRNNLVHLTHAARDMQEKCWFVANKTLKEVLRGLSVEELRVAQEVLRRVFSNTKE